MHACMLTTIQVCMRQLWLSSCAKPHCHNLLFIRALTALLEYLVNRKGLFIRITYAPIIQDLGMAALVTNCS